MTLRETIKADAEALGIIAATLGVCALWFTLVYVIATVLKGA
jgi:hypothetical protein